MSFPNTRHTLIHRIALGRDDEAWRQFLADYWGPVCRFAARRAGLQAIDAEDVASEVFEILLRNRLLERWIDRPAARLRTLICAVTRNVQSSRARQVENRARLIQEHAAILVTDLEGALRAVPAEAVDQFYAGWVDALVQSTVESLLEECVASGRGDQFRVLYGRLCEGLSIPRIAELLQIKLSAAEGHYRAARVRLSDKLKSSVRDHVFRYASPSECGASFELEWQQLGEYLERHGGLEEAVRRAYQEFEPLRSRGWESRLDSGALRIPSDDST